MKFDTLTVDGWAVAVGTARGEWAWPQPSQSPHRCTKCSSSPVNGQCTNYRISV